MCLSPCMLHTSRLSRCFFHTERKAAGGDIILNIQPLYLHQDGTSEKRKRGILNVCWWSTRHKRRGQSKIVLQHACKLMRVWRRIGRNYLRFFTAAFPAHRSRSISKHKRWIPTDAECLFVLKSVCVFRATVRRPHTTLGHGIHSNIFINMRAPSEPEEKN